MSDPIRLEQVTKLYRRMAPGDRLRTLKSALLEGTLTGGLSRQEAIVALDDVSFSVHRGEAFGIVGGNGSGKSTLLKTVAGILKPTAGTVAVDGRVAALIELGAGFHPEISGRENIFINGAVLGLARKEIERRYQSIVEFSGLADFIEEPVKNYSSGMYVRLGFAVAIHTDPDVLMVDEVLAVGDEAFAHRCLGRIEEFLAQNKTLLLVSHSLAMVEDFCDRVLWMDHGRARMIGDPRRVIDAYRQAVADDEGEAHRSAKALADADAEAAMAEPQGNSASSGESGERTGGASAYRVHGSDGNGERGRRWGSGQARIDSLRILAGGEERYHVRCGEAVVFELQAHATEALDDFVFGVMIHTPRGVECWGTNTGLAGFEPELFDGKARVRLCCPALRLAPGEYTVDAAVHAEDGSPYDYRKRVATFTVTAEDRGAGIYFPRHEWQVEGDLRWQRNDTVGDDAGSGGGGGDLVSEQG
jgi:ABC-type polysaccharide/polyol phosphate transport system ATPase subunit